MMVIMFSKRLVQATLIGGAALFVLLACERADQPSCEIETDNVIPWAQFHQLEQPVFPYVARHQGCGKTLIYVAARHTNNPQSNTFQLIRDQFSLYRFDRVILEGFITRLGENPASMIELANTVSGTPQDNEAMLSIRETIAMDSVFIGGEASDLEIDEALSPLGFSRRDQFYYYCLRAIEGWIGGGRIVDHLDPALTQQIEALAQTLSPQMQSALRDADVDFSVQGLAQWYSEINGVEYQASFRFGDAYFTDPALSRGTNKLAIALADMRDGHILTVIDQALRSHDSVLVVYGGSHHTVQKRAIVAAYPQ